MTTTHETRITFGRNTRTTECPDGFYPVKRDGHEVGYIDYGSRGAMMLWRVYAGALCIAASPTLAGAKDTARWYFAIPRKAL